MRKPAYEFATLIDARMDAISTEEYHKRPRQVKRLIEELYPLSRLALAFKQPGLDVNAEAFENSGRADGHIWISGYLTKDFEVQVTFAGYGEKEALRSALLVRDGFVPGAGPIGRDKKTGEILATMEAQDYYEPINILAASIIECARKKVLKIYPVGTILIIAFEDIRLRGRGWWKLLYSAIDNAGGLEKGNFSQIYFFNGCSNEIQQAA